MANKRGYDPAPEAAPARINQVMQNEVAGVNAPSVQPSDAQTGGRGADTPIVNSASGQNTSGGLSGISVEPSDAQTNGRGADTPRA